ncbi:MAG: hypothetical protein HKO57_05480 [Akkermansiaceae bacterium]|nr:hypothetical protein [Akkermansiaceae bacterium]
MRVRSLVLGMGIVAALALGAEERPLLYPFDVEVDGRLAVMPEGNTLFAVVRQPVQAGAAVTLEKPSPLLVINAFPCKEDGTVLEGQPAGVIFARETNEVKLDATIDKKPLAPGTYLMNVVAHGKTSRVVFTVADKDGTLKMPDIKKIFAFLKKKAGEK